MNIFSSKQREDSGYGDTSPSGGGGGGGGVDWKERMSSMYLSAKSKSSTGWDSFSKKLVQAGSVVKEKSIEAAAVLKETSSVATTYSKGAVEECKKRLHIGVYSGITFGGRIDLIVTENAPVSEFLADVCNYMDDHALKTAGLFRLPGSLTEINELKRTINRGESIEWESCSSPLVVASLLLVFLNELVESVIPPSHVESFTSAMDCDTREERINGLRDAVISLPLHNYEMLRYICAFFLRVTMQSTANGCSSDSAAVVLAPALMRMSNSTSQLLFAALATEAISSLIDDFDSIFPHMNLTSTTATIPPKRGASYGDNSSYGVNQSTSYAADQPTAPAPKIYTPPSYTKKYGDM